MTHRNTTVQMLFSLGVVVLLLLGTFGVFTIGMSMNTDGTMAHCPFGPGMSICTMSPLEMVSAPQDMLMGLLVQNSIPSILFFIVSTLLVIAIFRKAFLPPRLLLIRSRLFEPRFISHRSPLQEAFSNGILHSKLF